MIKKRSKTVITNNLIDDIWFYYTNLKASNPTYSPVFIMRRIAEIINCSYTSVVRVIKGCSIAEQGDVIYYGNNSYGLSKDSINYINEKFATCKESSTETCDNSKESSDIKLLADSVNRLAAALEKQNEYVALFDKVFKRVSKEYHIKED